jgi:signal recognition particle receptor subunit beta
MGVLNRERREIHAKIVYYGPDQSGKTSNVEFIQRKLKREHRGELKVSHVGPDRETAYEFLAVTLGTVRGYSTSIHIYTVPGGEAQRELRRQVLDGADGVVFVADLRPERHQATLDAAAELKEHLQSYGRSLDDIVLVIQYNRRGQASENALDELHHKLGLNPSAYFEAVANEGTGVLQTLTTLSKQILSNIRTAADKEPPEPEQAVPLAQVELTQIPVESEPASMAIGPQTKGFCLESAGPVDASEGELRIPILLTDEESGRKVELCLRLSLGEE